MSFIRATYIVFIVVVVCLLTGCSSTRHLPKGELLYTGCKINIKDNQADKKEKKILTGDLKALIRPKPNSKVLGLRLKLWVYNAAGNTKKNKGLRRWMRNKAGEPPVETSNIHLGPDKAMIINYMENRGYFYPSAIATMKEHGKKKASAVFDVTTGPQYTINKTIFQKDSSDVAGDIDSGFNKTLLTPNAPYNLTLIKAERVRIDKWLKQRGFYFFSPDDILVVADTSIGNHKVNLYVKLKHKNIPAEAYQSYSINNIYIYADYKLNGLEQDTSKTGIVKIDDYYVIDNEKAFKPSVFSEAMVCEKGDEYNIDDQNASVFRLVNMGAFKFVKNRFEPVNDSLLDVYYYLTPYEKKSIRFEIGALTQNDNRAGTEGSISWKNRNTFKGAEQLMFKINGGFEAQYSGIGNLPNIYNFGAETDLTLPRFSIPFISIQTTDRYLPRTVFKLKYQYESESNLLRINSYTASYGFTWKQGAHIQHQFYPFNFTYVKTDTLGDVNQLSLLYGNLIFNGIIEGSTYEFTYSSQGAIPRKNTFYFDGLIDLAGNILGIAEHADYHKTPSTIFGSAYAQYLKVQPDFRYYLRLSPAGTIASRIMAGIGIPYGNSFQMPNIKQFWAGGNSDLRGFPSRLAGPGTFNEYTQYNATQYIETLGDLKLEANIELRHKLYKIMQGAIFIDAGNIWLFRPNTDIPGGEFTPSFYKEISADAGIGLRFDFSIFILRLDLGMPIREAWLPENDRWVFNRIAFSESAWRRQNMVFNIGIGYPF